MTYENESLAPPSYQHRMMRCKLDRNARIGTRRYRAGELLQPGDAPTDDFEEFTPPPPKPEKDPSQRRKIPRLRDVPEGVKVTVLGKGPIDLPKGEK